MFSHSCGHPLSHPLSHPPGCGGCGVGPLVLGNVALSAEPHRAHRASVGLLAGVGLLVPGNVALAGESPWAHRARIRLLAGVGPLVRRNAASSRCRSCMSMMIQVSSKALPASVASMSMVTAATERIGSRSRMVAILAFVLCDEKEDEGSKVSDRDKYYP